MLIDMLNEILKETENTSIVLNDLMKGNILLAFHNPIHNNISIAFKNPSYLYLIGNIKDTDNDLMMLFEYEDDYKYIKTDLWNDYPYSKDAYNLAMAQLEYKYINNKYELIQQFVHYYSNDNILLGNELLNKDNYLLSVCRDILNKFVNEK